MFRDPPMVRALTAARAWNHEQAAALSRPAGTRSGGPFQFLNEIVYFLFIQLCENFQLCDINSLFSCFNI